MARLLRADPQQFEQLTEIGRQFFFGPCLASGSDLAGWLDSFMEGVADHITADAESGPLKFRYLEEDGFWEITAYPSAVELLGGAMDGEIVAPGFSLDLEGLRALFDRVVDFGWSALGYPTEGPHVSIEGVYQGHEVLLRVLAHPPDDGEPGLKMDVSTNR